jgi:WD40 repeat protein
MLPSQQPHPSPPSIIAISSDGSILLSASSTPPTIYLQDRRWGGSAPVNFHPTDAHTPVSCAAFQTFDDTAEPSYANFLLGFQDGRIVIYRLLLPAPPAFRKDSESHHIPNYHLQPVRIGIVKRLHKPTIGGVAAAEFVPGYKSRIVSISHDGRCRLVDFEGGGKVLRT